MITLCVPRVGCESSTLHSMRVRTYSNLYVQCMRVSSTPHSVPVSVPIVFQLKGDDSGPEDKAGGSLGHKDVRICREKQPLGKTGPQGLYAGPGGKETVRICEHRAASC